MNSKSHSNYDHSQQLVTLEQQQQQCHDRPYRQQQKDDVQQPFRLNEDAASDDLPTSIAHPILVGYRSVGIGMFGAVMRFGGMPLEKIALIMNSSQVSGQNQFAQAVKLTFNDGVLAPYRVVGPSSLTAWFLQYSVMGIAFQFCDQMLSQVMNVRPMYYGKELMEPPEAIVQHHDALYTFKSSLKTVLAPVLAASLESLVSNRAEVQRYFGPNKFASLRAALPATSLYRNPFVALAGPAFLANAARNVIMCQNSFVLIPLTYKNYFPEDHKNKSTLFWYGLSLNIFCGNIIAITQQALWGRSLDHWANQITNKHESSISYRQVVQQGLLNDGVKAFFTVPKWFSRVLMNAPAQGTLPWFYNEVLPVGEPYVLEATKSILKSDFLTKKIPACVETATSTASLDPVAMAAIRRRGTQAIASHWGLGRWIR